MIFEERPGDREQVLAVVEAAFGKPDEAALVQRLWHDGDVLASFVAVDAEGVIGHVLFSRMFIDMPGGRSLAAVAMAPVAVAPSRQSRGVGSSLIRHGLEWLRRRGESIVIVLGHARYYPRFGFSPALAKSLDSPFPGDSFMALELVANALDGVRGRVRYAKAFGLS